MMRYITAFFALAILIGTCGICAAAEETFTCTLSRAYDCYPNEGCKEWTIEEMALPRFVRIDLKAKTITSLDKFVPHNSKISSIAGNTPGATRVLAKRMSSFMLPLPFFSRCRRGSWPT